MTEQYPIRIIADAERKDGLYLAFALVPDARAPGRCRRARAYGTSHQESVHLAIEALQRQLVS